MNDDIRDLESLRDVARELRREPDAAMLARVRAGVREQTAVPPSPWEILAGWLRPAAISVAAIAALGLVLFTYAPETIPAKALAESVVISWEAALGGE